MSRVGAHDEHHATAAHNFATLANPFDAGSHFHGNTLVVSASGESD
jgi:hypothetical protein